MTRAGDLLRDMRVERDPTIPGRYRCDVTDAWNILYAFGGLTMSIAVNAARAELRDPETFRPISASTTFLQPVSAGPVVLDVQTLRASRGAHQMSVDLRPEGQPEPAMRVACLFAPRRDEGVDVQGDDAPEVADPLDIVPAEPPPDFPAAKLPYSRSVEIRTAIGNMPWDMDWSPGPAHWAGWFRFVNTPRLPSGMLDPLAYVPPCDMLGPAMLQARGPAAEGKLVISLDLTVQFLAETDSEWLLQDTRCQHASQGYALGTVHLRDERRRLVAFATQRAVIRPRPEFSYSKPPAGPVQQG